MYIHMYIYIYIERERERRSGMPRGSLTSVSNARRGSGMGGKGVSERQTGS